MAQKFGGAIGGSAVVWLLSGFGYITDAQVLASDGVTQPAEALECLRWLMSFIPAGVAFVSMCIVYFYPLTTERIRDINDKLKVLRQEKM